jgi:nitrogen fixation NifU-like protein
MRGDLRELYQETILDHSRRPRNFGAPEGASARAEGHNPLCGDRLTLYLTVEDGIVKEAAFQGAGCSISTASASMMTEAIKGRTREEVERLFARFHAMVTAAPESGAEPDAALGKLAVFSGVCEFPARVKCASLAWHTLKAALERSPAAVSTE